MFHTKLNICFRRLVLMLEMFFFFVRICLKQSYRSLQYNVNHLGTRFLSTCYSNFCWIPSERLSFKNPKTAVSKEKKGKLFSAIAGSMG